MNIDDKFRDQKLQYDINRAAAKISALSPGKIGKCDCLTGDEILPQQKHKITKDAKFIYSLLVKALEKQRSPLKSKGKQVSSLEALDLNNRETRSAEDILSKY